MLRILIGSEPAGNSISPESFSDIQYDFAGVADHTYTFTIGEGDKTYYKVINLPAGGGKGITITKYYIPNSASKLEFRLSDEQTGRLVDSKIIYVANQRSPARVSRTTSRPTARPTSRANYNISPPTSRPASRSPSPTRDKAVPRPTARPTSRANYNISPPTVSPTSNRPSSRPTSRPGTRTNTSAEYWGLIKPGSPLTDRERKYCTCVLKVGDNQSANNPYAICTKSVKTQYNNCAEYYDWANMDLKYIQVYARLRGINVDGKSRQQLINDINMYKASKGKTLIQQ